MTRAERRAELDAVFAAFDRQGRPVKAVCFKAGALWLLTETPVGALPEPDADGDWTDLAGQTEVSRAQGA